MSNLHCGPEIQASVSLPKGSGIAKLHGQISGYLTFKTISSLELIDC